MISTSSALDILIPEGENQGHELENSPMGIASNKVLDTLEKFDSLLYTTKSPQTIMFEHLDCYLEQIGDFVMERSHVYSPANLAWEDLGSKVQELVFLINNPVLQGTGPILDAEFLRIYYIQLTFGYEASDFLGSEPDTLYALNTALQGALKIPF